MAIFAIVLEERNVDVEQRIGEHFRRPYQINDVVFLVEGDFIAGDVAISAGIKGDNRIEGAHGAVFRLNGSYSGFASRSLWDWLGQSEEKK